MIADEVNYVWGASGTLGKILYFFARYPPYIDAVLALIRMSGRMYVLFLRTQPS